MPRPAKPLPRPVCPTPETLVSPNADGVVKVNEAARFLAVGRTELYAMMARGELPYLKHAGHRKIPKRALVAYLDGLRDRT